MMKEIPLRTKQLQVLGGYIFLTGQERNAIAGISLDSVWCVREGNLNAWEEIGYKFSHLLIRSESD